MSQIRVLPAIALLAALFSSAPLLAQDSTPGATSADSQSPEQASAAPSGKVTGSKTPSHPAWFKESFLDIGDDVSEAADDDKHVILLLEMNGCPYCYKMVEENFKGSDYSDFIQERFDVIALNVRGDREVALDEVTSLTEKALAEQLGVRYTPTVLFLNQENEPVARINGYRNVADFERARLRRLQSLSGPDPSGLSRCAQGRWELRPSARTIRSRRRPMSAT